MPHKRAKRSVREAEFAKKGYNLAPKSAGAVDDTPRSASRILNGWNVQEAFRASGRTTSEDTGERKKRKRRQNQAGSSAEKNEHERIDKPSITKQTVQNSKLYEQEKQVKSPKELRPSIPRIMPHETLGDYNRRVENLLRPGVSKAIKEAKSVIKAQEETKKAKGKNKAAQEEEKPGEGSDTDLVPSRRGVKRKSEFDAAPTHKRLNDIAQAPPTLLHLKKGPQKATSVWGAKGQGKSGLSAGQERILAEERERVVLRYREMKAQKEAMKGRDQGGKGSLA